jgi:hypothetical protein
VIPVELTCESRPDGAGGHAPLIAINGRQVWEGRSEPTAEDAERVALDYLRFALGGTLGGPPDAAPPRGPEEPSATSGLTGAVEALGRELSGALREIGDFLERGDWRRFLG